MDTTSALPVSIVELIQVAPVGAAIVIVLLFLRQQKEVAEQHRSAIADMAAQHTASMQAISTSLSKSLDGITSAIAKQDILLQRLVDKLEVLERKIEECPSEVADELRVRATRG